MTDLVAIVLALVHLDPGGVAHHVADAQHELVADELLGGHGDGLGHVAQGGQGLGGAADGLDLVAAGGAHRDRLAELRHLEHELEDIGLHRHGVHGLGGLEESGRHDLDGVAARGKREAEGPALVGRGRRRGPRVAGHRRDLGTRDRGSGGIEHLAPEDERLVADRQESQKGNDAHEHGVSFWSTPIVPSPTSPSPSVAAILKTNFIFAQRLPEARSLVKGK